MQMQKKTMRTSTGRNKGDSVKRKLTGCVMRYKWGKVVPKYAPSIFACLVLLGKKSP